MLLLAASALVRFGFASHLLRFSHSLTFFSATQPAAKVRIEARLLLGREGKLGEKLTMSFRI